MTYIADLLPNMRNIKKLYENICHDICVKYHLSQIEMDILIFLANHPTKDTASDIVEIRMLPKANVSVAVELLIKKEMIQRIVDDKDRRKIHLRLEPITGEIIEDIREAQVTFSKCLFEGFTEEEYQLFVSLNQRISKNAQMEY